MQAEEESPPPPPERGSGQGSAENSFNDSNSTTQSNVTSECSEAECDREPLVKQRGEYSCKEVLKGSEGSYLNFSVSASPVDPSKEMTTEEMRKLIERNEIVQTGNGLKPYNTVNV